MLIKLSQMSCASTKLRFTKRRLRRVRLMPRQDTMVIGISANALQGILGWPYFQSTFPFQSLKISPNSNIRSKDAC